MLNKYFLNFSKLVFWLAPVLIWIFWQLILLKPNLFWEFFVLALALVVIAAVEAVGPRLNKFFLVATLDLLIFVAAFFLFLSLLTPGWLLQFILIYFVWHLYAYFISIKKFQSKKVSYFQYFSSYNSLVSFFLFSSLFFGLQSFLNWSPWILIVIISPLVLANMLSIAFIQSWLNLKSLWFWLFLSLIVVEFIFVLTLLPFNYLVLGILSVLFYYSIFNFTRLYLTNRLTKSKIKNYSLFIVISLLIIFLTTRWL